MHVMHKNEQRGFIGLLALLITVLIIGIWFAMDAKNLIGTGGLAPTSDTVAPSAIDRTVMEKAKDVKSQVEDVYKNQAQQYNY